MEPTAADVSQVIDFAGLNPVTDKELVINALKSNNGNQEAVLTQYFDDADNFRTKYSQLWQDQLFSGDRDGGPNNSTGISFHVESTTQNARIEDQDAPMNDRSPGAPSRPPSRANSRSPLGKVVEWAAPDLNGVPSAQAQQEEDDMQRALRESAQEAGLAVPAQTSGVIDSNTSLPAFGPATRESYDQDSWAMVPAGAQETKVDYAPSASKRKRTPGAPAFLVQGISVPGVHNLGGLLTILHQIPLARNVLLSVGSPASSYGYNNEWWNGQEILPEYVLANLRAGRPAWGESSDVTPRLEEEIHRIMALLDSTERAYGTVSTLTEIIPMSTRGPEKQFYESLASQPCERLQTMYQTATLADWAGDSTDGQEVANFGLLEMEHPKAEYANIKTLYESLDHVMWNDALTWNEIQDETKMAMFRTMGEVLVLKVSGTGPDDSIEIPVEFYPEKYLASRKDEARRIQAAWVETKVKVDKFREEESRVKEWRDNWSTTVYDKSTLVNKAKVQWETYQEYLDTLGRFRTMEASGFDNDLYPNYHAAPSNRLSNQEIGHIDRIEDALQKCQKLLTDIEGRLDWLKTQIEQLHAKQRFLGQLLTKPHKNRPKSMECKKYLLRGVATDMDIMYVCQRTEPDLIDFGQEHGSSDQWWRLARTTNLEQQVEKVEIARVLRDMWRESKTPLMVYATEDALNEPVEPLPSPLERFVKADNKAFRQELSREESVADVNMSTAMDGYSSPAKRKLRADSMDSMNSNRPSIASIDLQDRDALFADQFEESSRYPEGQQEYPYQGGSVQDITMEDYHNVSGPSKDMSRENVREAHYKVPSEVDAPESATTASRHGQEARTALSQPTSPEMQEKARPPSLVARSPVDQGQPRGRGTLDMEIPEQQE